MTEGDWVTWLRRTTGEHSSRAIADRVGRSHTTVQRWMRSGIPTEMVFELAVRFHADILDTLVMMGWIDDDDLSALNVGRALEVAPASELTGELHRRALAAAHVGIPTAQQETLLRAATHALRAKAGHSGRTSA